MLSREIPQIVHVLQSTCVDHIANISEEIFVCFGSHAEDRMIFAIVSLDILEEAIVVLAEVLVARC
jgi:hypothetical protein